MSERPEKRRSYEELVGDTRSALEAEGDLPAERWVRIRQGIDDSITRPHGHVLRWAMALAAVLILGVWWARGDEERPRESVVVAEQATPPVEVVAVETVVPPILVVQVADGSRLEATETVRRWKAFERHEVILSPGGVVVATRWQPGATDLLLSRGTVTADVDKLQPGEMFQIRTRDAVVRVVGTRFIVQLLAGGGTQVSVQEGTVEVTDQAGQVARLTPGDQRRFGVTEVLEEEPPSTRRAPKQSVQEPARDLKVIEIEVPPQSAPVPEQMKQTP